MRRDLAARDALVRAAKRILRRTGALVTYMHPIQDVFPHALGTVRMGVDPRTSPLDEWGGYRGVSNLFVSDASALPRSAWG
jgi:choline dehydrogenase-like flavoprotein